MPTRINRKLNVPRALSRPNGRGGAKRLPPLSARRGPMPDSYTTRLKYTTIVALDPGTGTWDSHVFSANGAFDPDISGGGHQPMGFDQMMALYNHYTVVRSKISIHRLALSSSNLVPCELTLAITGNGATFSAATSIDQIKESVGVVGKPIMVGAYDSSCHNIWDSATFTASKFFADSGFMDVQYKGSVTSNPTEGAFFEIAATSIGGNTPGQVNLSVVLEYEVVFSEVRPLTSS